MTTDSLTSTPAPRPSCTPSPASPSSSTGADAGLLVLRLVLGATMASHGAQKLFGWFGGNGLEGTGKGFATMGFPAPETMAAVAGLTETAGGLGIAFGLLTPLAGAVLFGTLLNILAVTRDGGFFAPEGVEHALLLAAGTVAVTLAGPGRLALDRALPVLRHHRPVYGAAALVVGAVTAAVVLLLRN